MVVSATLHRSAVPVPQVQRLDRSQVPRVPRCETSFRGLAAPECPLEVIPSILLAEVLGSNRGERAHSKLGEIMPVGKRGSEESQSWDGVSPEFRLAAQILNRGACGD